MKTRRVLGIEKFVMLKMIARGRAISIFFFQSRLGKGNVIMVRRNFIGGANVGGAKG